MFDHLIALFGLSLEQELIDNGGGKSLFAQASGGLLQGLGPVRFLAGGGIQGFDAFWTGGGRRYEWNHVFFIALIPPTSSL